MTKDVVGLFDDLEPLEKTINDLETSGFDRAMISILNSKMKQASTHQQKMDHIVQNIDRLERLEPHKRDSFFIAKGTFTFISLYIACVIALSFLGLDYLYSSPWGFLGYTAIILVPTFAICYFLSKKIGQRFLQKEKQEIKTGGIALMVKAANANLQEKAKTCMVRNGAILPQTL